MRGGFKVLVALACVLTGGAGWARPLVAVIDSGVARTPELQSVVVAEHDMVGARPAFQPRYDHGTMVATIINREAKGAIDIVSLRIDDPAGCPAGAAPPCQPSPAPLAAAIRKATSLGVDAINISLSMPEDPSIVAAVHDAAAQGVMVVMAAGNDGFDHPGNRKTARAGYPKAVLVGAVDASGQPWTRTNRPEAGEGLGYDYVWRLGVNVPTMTATGMAVGGTGTSFAAPIETAQRVLAKAAAPAVAVAAAAKDVAASTAPAVATGAGGASPVTAAPTLP